MVNTEKGNELSNKILAFHKTNLKKRPHQPIWDLKASYFQYSRYFGILEEFKKMDFENMLDVGCAEGMFLLGVKSIRPDVDVFGVDFTAIGLQGAINYSGKVGFLTCADATHLPFSDNSFDLVLCSETLEHIVNDIAAFNEVQRVCKKNCVITVPSFSNRLAKEHFTPDIDCKFDSHLRKYTREDLNDILQPYFKKVTIYHMSMWYLSTFDILLRQFTDKRVSEKIANILCTFAALDYRLCKAGAHGHSYICICQKY